MNSACPFTFKSLLIRSCRPQPARAEMNGSTQEPLQTPRMLRVNGRAVDGRARGLIVCGRRAMTSPNANDPEGGIPAGPLEVLGRFETVSACFYQMTFSA